jgi:hypothetical protein
MRCSEIAPSRVACIKGRLSPCLGSTRGTTISMLGIPKARLFIAEDPLMRGLKKPLLRQTDPDISGTVQPFRAPNRKSWRATSPLGIWCATTTKNGYIAIWRNWMRKRRSVWNTPSNLIKPIRSSLGTFKLKMLRKCEELVLSGDKGHKGLLLESITSYS